MITVDPFKDPLVSREIALMDQGVYKELKQYKGQEPKLADLRQTEKALHDILHKHLLVISKLSLTDALKEIGGAIAPASLELEILRDAELRAAMAARQIMETTATAFGVVYAAMKKKQAVGKDRSKTIAEYEGPKMFFETRRKGWGLAPKFRKAWYTQSDNVCDICQENENQGAIFMGDPFESEDMAPPAHPNCYCIMGLIF